MNEPRVKVVDVGRKFLVLRWNDLDSGQAKQKSAKTANRKEAERLAGSLEDDLKNGRHEPPNRLTWEALRERFEQEKLPLLSLSSADAYSASLNVIERTLRPNRVSDLTSARISYYQAQQVKKNARPATIACHLRHLKAVLNWGRDIGLIQRVPKIKIPKQHRGTKLMRGRPLTDAEFQRMLAVTVDVVAPELVDAWHYFLKGLWWSGLRLSEALNLYWDRRDRLSVDFSGERPMLRILAEFEKGKRDRILPMSPEFAQLLNGTPLNERTGRVFEPAGKGIDRRQTWFSKQGTAIGRKAEIVVDTDPISGKSRFAGLHDLRRSFGERWSQRLMPQQLMELMRHESIDTTLKFYVGVNATRTAHHIWNVFEAEQAGQKAND